MAVGMNDWRAQLGQLKQELEDAMTPEEKEAKRREEIAKRNRLYEFNKRRTVLYQFLAGYKQNSGIFVNNFFRNRDFKLYCEDKFHGFDFDVSGIMPNVFDNMDFSMKMVQYLGNLDKEEIAYHPLTESFVEHLIVFSECLDLLEPLEEDLIVYRGCSTIERNGVNGIVSTTTDRHIAEQFSRGTLLTMLVPKGTKNLKVRSIRPKKQQKDDIENEILLPPCNYKIISDKEVKKGREPNNRQLTTRLLEIEVQPLDLLEEFVQRMENPPEEYLPFKEYQGESYNDSLMLIKTHIAKRSRK